MKLFMGVVGPDMPVLNLKTEHIDQFKKQQYERAVKSYNRKGWQIDDFKIKRGINKSLENIKTVLRAGAEKGIISDNMVPKIHKYQPEKPQHNPQLELLQEHEIIRSLGGYQAYLDTLDEPQSKST